MSRARIAIPLALALLVIGGLSVVLLRGSPDEADGQTRAAKPKPKPPACDIVASPLGAHVRGTVEGASALVRRLRPGQTGCLRGGVYAENVTIAGREVTLRGFPRERATIVGRLWVTSAASGVTVERVALNGRNERSLPSPTVNGSRTTFDHVDVTNDHTAICFIVGSPRYGRAVGTVIRNSRIHDCGRLPATNFDHGIYVAAADDTAILNNVIVNNADRGVQLYPDAQRTRIVGNIIDGNGEGIIISGAGGVASNDSLITNNVISNSRIRGNVESFYEPGAPIGTGNVVTRNCLWGGDESRSRLEPGGRGFTATDNVYADPKFVDPARGNYTVAASSRCAALLKAENTISAETDHNVAYE